MTEGKTLSDLMPLHEGDVIGLASTQRTKWTVDEDGDLIGQEWGGPLSDSFKPHGSDADQAIFYVVSRANQEELT